MKIFKYFFLLILFGTPCLSYSQKYEWKDVVSTTYPYRYVSNDPLSARFYTLRNGLTVILSQNTKEPRISARIVVRTGSNNDPREDTGLAHYLEHLLFKGTDKYGSLDWAKEKPLLDSIDNLYELYNSTTDEAKRAAIYKTIDEVSGKAAKFAIAGEYWSMMSALGSLQTNAYTTADETVYEENIPANAIDKFLEVQAERFRNPVFRIFHTELEAVYEEKNRGLDNDANKMQEAMLSLLFPSGNYGLQTTIGTVEHLKNPSIKAIQDYYHKYYVPNNMAIIMAGDFNPDEMIKKIDMRFSYLQTKKVEEYRSPIEKPIEGPIVKEIYGPSSESVRILFRGYKSGTREAMLSDLTSAIFANRKAGLIDLNLNMQQKLLRAGASLWQFKDYGIFFLSGSPKQGQTLEEVKDLLMEQVNFLRKGNFDESLIKSIASNAKLSQLQDLESNTSRVSELLDQYARNKGIEWNHSVGEVEEMSRISKQELVNFANQFLRENNFVILYKRKGEDKSILKVDKPTITPVETNTDKKSPFAKSIIETPLPSIKPVWIDYNKELTKGKIGNAEVFYVQNKNNGLFRLTYRFAMGNWNNKVLPIASQYLKYLGTDKLSSQDISRRFYDLACEYSFQVTNEETIVRISGLQENFEEAVSLYEELINNCKPDETALEGLKNLLLKSRANSKLNKDAISMGLQYYAVYGQQNPFNFVLTDQELKDLKSDDLTSLLHSIKSYQHSIGYFGPQTQSQFESGFQQLHKLPSKWQATTSGTSFTRTAQTENKVLFCNYDAVQAEIYWVKNLDIYDPKSEAIVDLYNNYFGVGPSSVVFSTIRESKALAYSTYAEVVMPAKKNDRYSLFAYVGSQADKMNDAITAMNDLLKTLPSVEKSFENARTSLIKSIETNRIVNDNIISNYVDAKRKGLDYDIRKVNYGKYGSLTFNDLSNYHNKEISGKHYTYCVVASDQRIKMTDLQKQGALTTLSLTEIFGY